MKKIKYKVALIQLKIDTDPNKNLNTSIEKIKEAKSNDADLVCLPELFLTRYFCQSEDPNNFDYAEAIPGATTDALSKVAKENRIVVIAPVFEKRALGIYHNSCTVIDADGEIKGVYRKMHIPDDPGYHEKFYFTPGDLGYKSFETSIGNVGSLICWDQWFPEAARLVSLDGAAVIFYPTAIGWHPEEKDKFGKDQLEAWMTVQRGHAISNGVYVAAVNRVGFEEFANGGIEFWGNSFICDPFGKILARASDKSEEIIYAEIDINVIEDVRRNWPFLRDRRIDSYGEINKRYLEEKSRDENSR